MLFEQLFGDGANDAQRAARRAQALSLLDSVTEQIRGLDRTLPAADRQRLDHFVTDVREIERRINQSAERVDSHVKLAAASPAACPRTWRNTSSSCTTCSTLAWQTEITRISTFMVAKELSNAVYPKSGVRDSFHILSHHSNNEDNKARFAVLNRYHSSLFAYFLEKLQQRAGR